MGLDQLWNFFHIVNFYAIGKINVLLNCKKLKKYCSHLVNIFQYLSIACKGLEQLASHHRY